MSEFNKKYHQIVDKFSTSIFTGKDIINSLLNKNIIIEDKEHPLIDIPAALIHDIISKKYFELNEFLLKKYFKRSKHYNNIKTINCLPIYIAIINNYDLNNIKKLFQKLCGNNYDENDIKNFPKNKYFDGITIECNNKYIILINTCNFDFEDLSYQEIYNNLYHELSHLLQLLTGICISKDEYITNINNFFIYNYKFNNDDINYYFDAYEFKVYLNELLYVFKKIKNTYYKNMFNKSYIQLLFNLLNKQNIQFEQQFKYLNDYKINALLMYYCSTKIPNKLNYIKNKIIETFK